MFELLEIRNDLFGIVKRVKQIDKDYLIYLNRRIGRFELYKRNAKNPCCVLPYDRLDERTVRYVFKTHISNTDKLLFELEKNNNELLAKQREKRRKDFERMLAPALS